MFIEIKQLRPYFCSLRVFDKNTCIDLKLPQNWKYELPNRQENLQIKLQDANAEFNLISIISDYTEIGYNAIFQKSIEIIEFNKEQEERAKLFQEKIEQLKDLFLNAPIDKLKEINFLKENGQKDSTSNGLVEQRDVEGPDGNPIGQD